MEFVELFWVLLLIVELELTELELETVEFETELEIWLELEVWLELEKGLVDKIDEKVELELETKLDAWLELEIGLDVWLEIGELRFVELEAEVGAELIELGIKELEGTLLRFVEEMDEILRADTLEDEELLWQFLIPVWKSKSEQ